MSINCIIIDDEPFARKLLLDYCDKVPFLYVQAEFSNAIDAAAYLNRHPIDLLFLDIRMPDLDGLNFLKSLSSSPAVIFTTAFAEYAIEGFELDAIDYLLKPFDFPRFMKAVNKTQKNLIPVQVSEPENQAEVLYVKDGRNLVKVVVNEIRFIQGKKDYVLFQTKDRGIMSLMNMKELEQKLDSYGFIRVHQSYIVNSKLIDAYSPDGLEVCGERIPVSRTYKNRLLELMEHLKSN